MSAGPFLLAMEPRFETPEIIKAAFGAALEGNLEPFRKFVQQEAFGFLRTLSELKRPKQSFCTILNNHSTTKPKNLGGPANPPIDHSFRVLKRSAFTVSREQTFSFEVCLSLPNAFQNGDELSVEGIGSNANEEEAKELACGHVLAQLLLLDQSVPSKDARVLLRAGHWKVPLEEVADQAASFWKDNVRLRFTSLAAKQWQPLAPAPLKVDAPWKPRYEPPDNILGAEGERERKILECLQDIFRCRQTTKLKWSQVPKNFGLKLGTLLPRGQLTTWLAMHSTDFDFNLDCNGKLLEVIWLRPDHDVDQRQHKKETQSSGSAANPAAEEAGPPSDSPPQAQTLSPSGRSQGDGEEHHFAADDLAPPPAPADCLDDRELSLLPGPPGLALLDCGLDPQANAVCLPPPPAPAAVWGLASGNVLPPPPAPLPTEYDIVD